MFILENVLVKYNAVWFNMMLNQTEQASIKLYTNLFF